jgi:hypothetical protein
MNCLHCNKPIEGKRNTKKYCNNTCKQYAYLNRSFNSSPNLGEMKIDLGDSGSAVQIEKQQLITIKKEQHEQTELSKNKAQEIVIQEKNNDLEGYQYLQIDVLNRTQQTIILSDVKSHYFSDNTNKGGRITQNNIGAFAFVLPRIRCLVENLFQLSYKRKVYYKTASAFYKAIEQILLSEQLKQLPGDFPFFEDLCKLYEQFNLLSKHLEQEKEGVKFTLTKQAIIRYLVILNLIRHATKKEPFQKLFPELLKSPSPVTPNRSKV